MTIPPSKKIDPAIIIAAYKQGIFPMAESAEDSNYAFYSPEKHGQLSIKNLHIPKRLLKTLKQAPYDITINQAFANVINGCAATQKGRQNTWINTPIRDVFIKLHEQKLAHSVECWKDGELIGGLYGLAIGAVFCGESMFSTQKDASKIALVHLCARLWKGGFHVLDTQFTNEHLEQFGIYEIPQKEYEDLIQIQMQKPANFLLNGENEENILEDYLKMKQ